MVRAHKTKCNGPTEQTDRKPANNAQKRIPTPHGVFSRARRWSPSSETSTQRVPRVIPLDGTVALPCVISDIDRFGSCASQPFVRSILWCISHATLSVGGYKMCKSTTFKWHTSRCRKPAENDTERERERASRSPPNQALQGVFSGTTATVLIGFNSNEP